MWPRRCFFVLQVVNVVLSRLGPEWYLLNNLYAVDLEAA